MRFEVKEKETVMAGKGTKKAEGKVKPEAEGKVKSKRASREMYKTDGQLKKVPEHFDFAQYRPLKAKDFASRDVHMEFRAMKLRHDADVLMSKAREERALGDPTERKLKRRMLKLAETQMKLRKQLESEGVNVDELLKLLDE